MRIAVISTHPDDETLGMGGTLLRHKAQGDELHWIIATVTQPPAWPREVVDARAREVEEVAEAYGFASHTRLGFAATRLDGLDLGEIIAPLSKTLSGIRPEVVYVVHGGDAHTDHQMVFKSAMSALKPIHMRALGVRRVLCYETISSTEAAAPGYATPFVPNVLVDVSGWLEDKLEIMALYRTEIQEDPLPRGLSAIRAQARYRGAAAGVEYAEAFVLIRELG